MSRTLTGRHVLIIVLTGFGTVIAANLAMLFAATGTFPGLVVDNSYVASQSWDARLKAQEALGWRAVVAWRDGRLTVELRGASDAIVPGVALEALVGRPTLAAEDRLVTLAPAPEGYAAPVDLSPGAWRVELMTAGGPAYTQVQEIFVPEAD